MNKVNMIRFLVLMILLCPLTALSAEDKIEGRVFTEASALPQATVSVYRSYADLLAGSPPVASATTDQEGVYRLHLEPGPYYFIAKGTVNGREYYAYHGSNPVKTDEDNLWVALMATPVDPAPVYTAGTGTVEGVVTFKGQPVPGAYVALYPPDSKTFKGLGVKTESADASGRFKINIQPGKYVITARKIVGGNSNRPPRKGDLYCYYSQNPVEIKEDQTASLEFSCYPKIDRSSFVAVPIVKGDDFKTVADRATSADAGIRGRVADENGRPLPGLTVLAYPLASPVFMMYNLYHGTEYSSETDSSGKFFIPLDEDGDYGIVARDILGDGPHRGEIYGLYQGNIRHAVTFKKGTLVDNIAITAGQVMPVSTASQPNVAAAPAPVVIGTPGGAPVLLADSVISSNTVWQGEIQLSGVISVKRGATLTILPGTTVKFRRIDRDHNEIGDGEILVEGRLVARGTADQKIVFTSAEAKPAVNDWSYLQFLASDPGNVIEHCCFEYAFAGVMVHYADVRISDTLFRNNNRGLHYNTANLRVDHCTFTGNRIGIRFMRLEGNVQITNNDISRNDIGLLFVRQHVNAIDFDKLNRGKENPGIRDNNIFNNRNYNFSLGEGQDRDVNVAGNWWGSALAPTIAGSIYDQDKDKGLSRVIYAPFLAAPVAGAGVVEPKSAAGPGKQAEEAQP